MTIFNRHTTLTTQLLGRTDRPAPISILTPPNTFILPNTRQNMFTYHVLNQGTI